MSIANRRSFLRTSLGGLAAMPLACGHDAGTTPEAPAPPFTTDALSPVFQVTGVPDDPFASAGSNRHAGVDAMLDLAGRSGLKLYRSSRSGSLAGPYGLIAPDDVVLVKVNAQWKYRGCSNSDVVRGLVERLLAHPDGFRGEIVIVENGQGRGSLRCDTSSSYNGDTAVHANANDEQHSFEFLVEQVFRDPRVSSYLLDPIRSRFIGASDHATEGYRRIENVSYPCFTTRGGRRVELKEGVWDGQTYRSNLKLISVPVLKHHDNGGSEITGAVKHYYGLLSMSDGQSDARHYTGLGEACGKMMTLVRPPVLTLLDAIWVSHRALGGYPADRTVRKNQLLASQDPIALDFWAAKSVLYPIDNNERHAPTYPGIDRWLTDAMNVVNAFGGLASEAQGIRVKNVTKLEPQMQIVTGKV